MQEKCGVGMIVEKVPIEMVKNVHVQWTNKVQVQKIKDLRWVL